MNAETRAKEIVEKLLGEKQAFVKAITFPDVARQRWTAYEEAEALITQALRQAQNDKLEEAARLAENPGFIQARDTEWDMGVNYAKPFIANAIRDLIEKD